ncbi:MAG TPA: preprotein translocase subunit SecG [Clostridiales bacterium]|jgi:preprotein translocase subunit SecG|nr:preprotein translocase subunit SecG [Clostridiales bacterium]
MTIVLTILQLLSAIAIILIVLLQSGKKAGLSGAIGGISETFMSKNKSKSLDARLAKMTKWIGLVFVVLTIVLNIL